MIELCSVYLFFFVLSRSKIKYRTMCFWVVAMFSILGFFYSPTIGADLNLRFRLLDTIRKYGFETINTDSYWSGELGFKYFMRFVSFFPYNNFLPFFSALIGYSFIVATIAKIKKIFDFDDNYSKRILLLVLCFVSFDSMVNGIRTQLAFSILTYLIVTHLLEKKHIWICFIGYFLCTTIHPACVIPLVILVLTWMIKNRKLKTVVIIFAVWPFLLNVILMILQNFTYIPILYTIHRMLYDYTLNEKATINIVPNLYYAIRMVVRAQGIGVLLLCYSYVNRNTSVVMSRVKSNNKVDFSHLYVFFVSTCAFMLGGVISYHIFLRTAAFILTFSSVPIGMYFATGKNRYAIKISSNIKISFLSIAALLSFAYNILAYMGHIDFAFKLFN